MVDARLPADLPVVREQGRSPQGRRWLRALPGMLDAAVARWDLELGPPFPAGSAAWAAPAQRRTDGQTCVLKITRPHREARHEAAALRIWAGDGAVRLLAGHDPDYALLVERCRPGTPLQADPAPVEERLEMAAQLLHRLWQHPTPAVVPFEALEPVCRGWAALVRRRMQMSRAELDPGLVARGAQLLAELPGSATRCLVLHGDANPTNVLRAEREAWLAIDPKPMLGDPGYDVVPLILQLRGEPGGPPCRRQLRHDFGLVAAVVAEPVDRLTAWAMAREVEAGLWHVSRADLPSARASLDRARVLADLSGV